MALRRAFHVTLGLFASLNLIGYRNVSITGGFRLEQQIRILPSDSKGACHRNHRTGRHHRIKHVCRTENGCASLADRLRDRRLYGGAVTHEGLDAAGDQYDTYSHERRGHGSRRTGLHDSRVVDDVARCDIPIALAHCAFDSGRRPWNALHDDQQKTSHRGGAASVSDGGGCVCHAEDG